MQFAVWDGYDAYGISASDWKKGFPVPAGAYLLFILNDEGGLRAVQQWDPRSAGQVPITKSNVEEVKAWLLAQADGSTPPAGGGDFEQYKAMVDWLFLYVTTGEA